MAQRNVVLCASERTAIGVVNGKLNTTVAPALGATVIHTALTRFAFGTVEAGTVIMGNVVQAGNNMNPGQQIAVAGGMQTVDLAPYLQREAHWAACSQQRFAATQSAPEQVSQATSRAVVARPEQRTDTEGGTQSCQRNPT